MHDIFISYSHQDREQVMQLANALEAHGYDVWWDRRLLPSQDYSHKIEKALNASRCVITIWSTHSVASKWVRAESNRGFTSDKLIPVMIGTAVIPIPFDSLHSADLRNWDGSSDNEEFQYLLQAIERRIHDPAMPMEPIIPEVTTKPVQKNHFSWLLVGALAIGTAAYLFMPAPFLKLGLFSQTVDSEKLQSCHLPNDQETLIQAAGRGNIERVHECLESGALINTMDIHGWTALHAAANTDQLDIARVLVSKGSDIHAENKRQQTPLYIAVMRNSYRVAHYLKQNGAATDRADISGTLPFARATTEQMRRLLAE